MKNITFDTGIREYRVNGVCLRFNPADPLFGRRLNEAVTAMEGLKNEAEAIDREESGIGRMEKLCALDGKVRGQLARVFGAENDISRVFGGGGALAVGSNGELAAVNFLNAVLPEIRADIEETAKVKANAAVMAAKESRNQREAGR